MSRTQVVERELEVVGDVAPTKGEVAIFAPPRLPYHSAFKDRFGVEKEQWKALIEACYPTAKSIDSVAMVLSYCKARNLDPFKRPVHIVPMWNSNAIVESDDGGTKRGGYVDTIWPSIAELRTTAFRTGQYAGKDETQFGPMVEETFKGRIQVWENRQKVSKEVTVTVKYPEWAQITLYRVVGNMRCAFVGPKVYWLESYATQGKTDLPNEMWQTRPVGQLDKCAEAAALRATFPEELGNQYAAEEMEGRRMIVDPAEAARDVTPVTAAPKKAPPPPGQAEPAQVVESPSTAPEAGKVEVLPPDTARPTAASGSRKAPPPPSAGAAKPAQASQPKPDLSLPEDGSVPDFLKREAKPAAAAEPVGDAPGDAGGFLKWADAKLAAVPLAFAESFGSIVENEIRPHAESVRKGMFPGDLTAFDESVEAVIRKHENRLNG